MLLSGVILTDSYTHNMPNTLGSKIDKFNKNDEVQIVRINKEPDGSWYYIDSSGWIKATNVKITRDIEFLIKSKKMNILDRKKFGDNDLISAIVPLVDNSISRRADFDIIAIPGGCFGDNNGKSLDSLKGIENTTVGNITSSFGIDLGDGYLGKSLKNTTIGSIMDGSFFGNLLDSAVDDLFGTFFNRLKFVVGFDVESLVKSLLDDSSLNMGDSGETAVLGESMVLDGSGGSSDDFSAAFAKSIEYFEYLGCAPHGKMISHPTVNGQGEYYTDNLTLDGNVGFQTPLLTSEKVKEEVDFNNMLYENIYDEFEESINKVKDNVDLNITRLDWFFNFNRYRKTHPDYHLTNSQGHVFMTRPALNIFGVSSTEISDGIKNSADSVLFAEAIKRHVNIAKSLTPHLSGQHDFIPIIHNTARSLDIQDSSIDTVEYGEALTKWKIVYAQDMTKSLTSGNFSINYIDDYQLSISYLHLLWVYYMHGVSRGEYGPEDYCVQNGILDYAASCYYILTDATGEDIIFWSKYWGVFPTNYPSSSFSLSETPVKTPSINIQYAYSFKRDMDPLILAEFNRNSRNSNSFEYVPIHEKGAIIPSKTIVGPPFVDTEDGGTTYKLRFRKAPEQPENYFYSKGRTDLIGSPTTAVSSYLMH